VKFFLQNAVVAFQSPQIGFPWWMKVRGHRLTTDNWIASNALAGHNQTLLNYVPTRTKFNPTKLQLPTNYSALSRLPAPLVLVNKREWDVCLSVHTFVVRGKLLTTTDATATDATDAIKDVVELWRKRFGGWHGRINTYNYFILGGIFVYLVDFWVSIGKTEMTLDIWAF